MRTRFRHIDTNPVNPAIGRPRQSARAQVFLRADLRLPADLAIGEGLGGTARELISARSICDFAILGGFLRNMLFCSNSLQAPGVQVKTLHGSGLRNFRFSTLQKEIFRSGGRRVKVGACQTVSGFKRCCLRFS